MLLEDLISFMRVQHVPGGMIQIYNIKNETNWQKMAKMEKNGKNGKNGKKNWSTRFKILRTTLC